MTRVLVCGGREYKDRHRLYRYLDAEHRREAFSVVISGCARGADTFAIDWAKSRGVDIERYPAKWRQHGRRRAGPIRNQQMLDEGKPDLIVAAPGGNGTRDMVRRSKMAGVKVKEIDR